MRKYATRTKSTKSKSYDDYKAMRQEQEAKGYALKETMTKKEFDDFYERLKLAKKNGEIKSSPWQELKRRERLVSRAQAKALSKAATDLYGRKVTQKEIFGSDINKVEEIGTYLNENKSSGLYGGDYE